MAFTPIEDEVRYLVRSEDLVRPRPKDELDRISAIALARSIRSSDGDETEFEIDDDLSLKDLKSSISIRFRCIPSHLRRNMGISSRPSVANAT